MLGKLRKQHVAGSGGGKVTDGYNTGGECRVR